MSGFLQRPMFSRSASGLEVALLIVMTFGSARAQTPTGTIAGSLSDQSGAAVAGAAISVTNLGTGQARSAPTSAEGRYAVEALLPASYQVVVEVSGFKRLVRLVNVEAGTTTTVELKLEVGEVSEVTTAVGATPLLHHDHHQVGGVVGRAQIEGLPLNGRNFLELARLEPGVTGPGRQTGGRMFVASLGAGLNFIPRVGHTRVTVDGANITTPGTAGVLFNVSQEAVQEFQIATVNFDASTSMTTNGAINIVTRSGSNDIRGAGFYFYRDHHLAAYPALRRDPDNPDPFFRQAQFGSYAGAPLRKDHVFVFASYERSNQRGVRSVQPRSEEFEWLGDIFPSPSTGNLFSARADVRLSRNHTAFARYTHDGSRVFDGVNLPSGWTRGTNRAAQSIAALTSVLSPRAINEIRFSYFSTRGRQDPPTREDCPGCFGLVEPRILVGKEIAFGNVLTAGSGDNHRYQLTESVVWQTGTHRVRFGVDWEHASSTLYTLNREPALITLWSPQEVRQRNPSIPLPPSFTDGGRLSPASPAKLRNGRRPGGSAPTRIPIGPRARSPASPCQRHLDPGLPLDDERRPGVVVRAQRAEPRPVEAGAARSHPGTGRPAPSAGSDPQHFPHSGICLDGNPRRQDRRARRRRPLLRSGGQHQRAQPGQRAARAVAAGYWPPDRQARQPRLERPPVRLPPADGIHRRTTARDPPRDSRRPRSVDRPREP